MTIEQTLLLNIKALNRIRNCLWLCDSLSLCLSLEREMRVVGEDCGLQPVTIAMAFVYFEKLVLQGRLNKQNRYLDSSSSYNTYTLELHIVP